MSAPGLSVVLPTLDESDGLRVLLPRLRELFAALGVEGEILVVDGGSKDDTVKIAQDAGARVQRQRGRGFGSAVREGLEAARAEWVAVLDADGSHAPEALTRFWALRDEADLIVGSRYCRGGSAEMPLTRQILSRSLNIVTKRVLELPVHESSSGFRLYRAAAARAVKSAATDFSVQQDMLVGILAAGGRVLEVPIHYAPRVGGASKANAWKLLPAYIRLLLRLKRARGGWRVEAGLFAALGLALATGLFGITGGLPGPSRWRVLPEAARGSPEFARSLADSWRRLYKEIRASHREMRADEPRTGVSGAVRIPPGWTFPPDPLVNAARAQLTQSVNPDEKKAFIILSQMRPGRGDFEPLYAEYGGAFVYPLGAFLAAASVARAVRLTPDLGVYLQDPARMARLYEVGRLFVLLFHLLGVWAVYELGRLLSGRRAAAVAALLFALCPTVLIQAHVIKPHPVAAFWFLAGVCAMVGAIREGRPTDYLLCGLAAGLSCGGALTMVYGLGMPVLAWAFRRDGSWRAALGGVAAGLAAFAATNPYLLLRPSHFAWEFLVYMPSHASLSLRGMGAGAAAAASGAGLVLVLTAAAACAAAVRRGPERAALALLTAGGTVAMWARFPDWAGDPASLRFVYPLVGVACVLAADAALSLRPRVLGALLTAALLADTGLRGAVALESLGLETGPRATREAAGRWIDAHVPPGEEIGLARFPEPAHTPFFRWNAHPLVVFETPEALGGKAPRWLALDEAAARSLADWTKGRYEVAADFPRPGLLWARSRDGSFFADEGMVVLKRR
jgi:dolichol-phosphate mannosyltransferase